MDSISEWTPPDWLRPGWIAKDMDGTWYWYPDVPVINGKYLNWQSTQQGMLFELSDVPFVITLPACDDWTQSLRQIGVAPEVLDNRHKLQTAVVRIEVDNHPTVRLVECFVRLIADDDVTNGQRRHLSGAERMQLTEAINSQLQPGNRAWDQVKAAFEQHQ